MLAAEEDGVVASESALHRAGGTRSFMKVMTWVLDLLPRRKSVCLMPSTSLGSFLRSRRMARMDLGFSYICFNNEW